MSLPLHARVVTSATPAHPILKALTLDEALAGVFSFDRVAVLPPGKATMVDPGALFELGFAATLGWGEANGALPVIRPLSNPDIVGSGDVIRLNRDGGQLTVLYRRGGDANTLFLTERCNSRCLMCSQPPRDVEDGWRIGESLELISLIDRDLPQLGFSGGEPTLLGPKLGELIAACAVALPRTYMHILTNARRFADRQLADSVASALGRSTWGVPLYADNPARHDYVVQAAGAFEETVNGIYNLAERGHAVEIRFVVHAQTIGRLNGFVDFIWRNMPFVRHVALMGLEPMGYARGARDLLWIDPQDYAADVALAAQGLADRGVPVSLYNMPLCVLPWSVWPLARKSISDWKNIYAPECAGCGAAAQCGGFFASQSADWRSRAVRPISLEDASG